MSLDVYLRVDGVNGPQREAIFVRENGSQREVTREEWEAANPGREPVTCTVGETDEVFTRNITHNLGKMAYEAGIYMHLWRPDEIQATVASQLIEPLRKGLDLLLSDPERFNKLNPSNGWGDYDGLVAFVTDYLMACERYPQAKVRVWR